MQHNSVFLLNINTIILISLCSDYWILIKIREAILLELHVNIKVQIEPPPDCQLEELRQLSLLKCSNASYALVEQHANLLRQCNDLTDGYRQRIAESGRLYEHPCYWFIADVDGTWRNVESDWGMDVLAFLCAVASITVHAMATRESISRRSKNACRCLLAAAALYGVPVAISVHIIQSTNTRSSKNESEQMFYAEAGWSLVSAILAILLMVCASYSEHLQHRKEISRKESEKRRRLLHNAIMSSCRQDIAMAIRARMTVI